MIDELTDYVQAAWMHSKRPMGTVEKLIDRFISVFGAQYEIMMKTEGDSNMKV